MRPPRPHRLAAETSDARRSGPNTLPLPASEVDPRRRGRGAEEILIKDVGGIFLWHPIFTQLWKPYLKGPCLHQNKYGLLSWQPPQSGPQYYCAYVSTTKGS